MEQRSWWQRNWKWAVPLGCLGSIVGLVAFVSAIGVLAFGSIRASPPYKEALAMSQESPEVILELGEPIKAGWFVTGSISVSGPSGEAELAIPIRGPRKRGTLYVIAERRAGRWEYELVEVEVDGRDDRIDLLSPVSTWVSNYALNLGRRKTVASGSEEAVHG